MHNVVLFQLQGGLEPFFYCRWIAADLAAAKPYAFEVCALFLLTVSRWDPGSREFA